MAEYDRPMWEELITVAEIDPFPDQADALLTEEERDELVDHIARHPQSGTVIPGTGGLRKLRWARRGGGKRGGLRLIYYFYNKDWPVFLLTLYNKSQQEDLTLERRKKLYVLVEALKRSMKGHHPTRR